MTEWQAFKASQPLGTGPRRARRKIDQKAAEAAVIRAVRQAVFARELSCQLCYGSRRRECYGLDDQMHEEPPRSKTRGRPVSERFNERVCGRLCAACHGDVTRHALTVVFYEPERGWVGGAYAVVTRTGERATWIR